MWQQLPFEGMGTFSKVTNRSIAVDDEIKPPPLKLGQKQSAIFMIQRMISKQLMQDIHLRLSLIEPHIILVKFHANQHLCKGQNTMYLLHVYSFVVVCSLRMII